MSIDIQRNELSDRSEYPVTLTQIEENGHRHRLALTWDEVEQIATQLPTCRCDHCRRNYEAGAFLRALMAQQESRLAALRYVRGVQGVASKGQVAESTRLGNAYKAACATTENALTALKDEMWSEIAFPMVPWEHLTQNESEAMTMRDPIPPAKSEVQLSRVLAAVHTLKVGLNQRGRVALYSNADRWLCYLDEDSVSALRAIADALDQHLADSANTK